MSFYFYKKQGWHCSILLSAVESLGAFMVSQGYMTADDLSTEQHESVNGNLASYSNDAAAVLLKFYEDFDNDPGLPLLMIDEEFTYLIRPEIRLQGRFDLVLT
jgi:hypothetical protein